MFAELSRETNFANFPINDSASNRLSSIQAPLMLGQPSANHYPVIAECVLAEMAKRWSLERGILPSVDELELRVAARSAHRGAAGSRGDRSDRHRLGS